VKPVHLTRRFFGALRPGPPRATDREWVATVLSPAALALWNRMPNPDRRHSVAVARRVQHALASTPDADDPRWLAAALLHDVGKVDSGLGTYGRVVATLAGAAAGRDTAEAWITRRGFTRRVGLYLEHPRLGADMIRVAGGPEEAAVWAAAHHTPETWDALAIPRPVVDALATADDD
jgi:putative nucleotidyltransferase with HDIG domain